MRLLISGGPGSGCTATAAEISEHLGVAAFDSDAFFHKPSNPPFLEQRSAEERRVLLSDALSNKSRWIVSGSVATWGLRSFTPTHGVLLAVPPAVRLQRLVQRQRLQFGARIDEGGDMRQEHEAFIDWAAGYEQRLGAGRNLATDREFLGSTCTRVMIVDEVAPLQRIVAKILSFLR